MVKILIHAGFIILFLVSIGVNVALFTQGRDSQEYIDTKNTIEQLSEENSKLRETVRRFKEERDRLREERAEINRRLDEELGSAKGFILDAIESNKRIGDAASKLRDAE